MFQLDLTIILVVLNSLVFFGFGYYVGRDKRPIIHIEEHVEDPNWGKNIYPNFDPTIHVKPTGPKLGDFEPSNEPSGAIYRPTAKELKKIHEDDATREAKEAVADTLRNAEEPRI